MTYEIDRRTRHLDEDTAALAHAEGVMRTLVLLEQKGLLLTGG